ncbi:MAG: TAXI family TRAP transporter solute-binding subunit [Desulfobacteraceae bacterium]|jgi:TRAP transporter TAXI family solute receptor
MQKIINKWKSILIIVSLVAFIGAMPALSLAQQPVQLKLASFKIGSGWFVMAGVMADIFKGSLPPGSTVDALPKSGGIGNPKLLGAKKAEIGFAFPMTANWAWNGVYRYEKKIRNIRAIAGGLDSYWVLGAVKADKGVNSWADMKAKKMGLRICTQSKGSLSEFAARQVLGVYGISYQDLKGWGGDILMKGFKEMVPALKEGAIDGFLMMATPFHPTWTEAAISRPLKFLSMEDATLSQLGSKYGYTSSTVPAGMFRGLKMDVVTIGFPTCLLVREDISPDVTYTLLKAIVQNREKIQAAYKSFKAFDPKTGWKPEKVGGVPLHPGAEKYYKERGWK